MRSTIEGSGILRRDFLGLAADETLFLDTPVKSIAPSDSAGSVCRVFGATMTSACGERRANGRREGSLNGGSIAVTLMMAVEVCDKYIVIGCNVETARI